MNYILVEDFLKQPQAIQSDFINWWQPEIGDIYCDKNAYGNNNISVIENKDSKNIIILDKIHGYYIPLLTEGQLRQFIEDKIQDKLSSFFDGSNYGGYFYSFNSYKGNLNNFDNINIKVVDYLKALWELSLKVIKMEV